MSIETARLANGMWVATDRMAHVETASVGVWIKAGSRSENEEEHGIAHLLEHMAFKGTSRRSARDIAVAIESVGGDLNAATSMESTTFHARVLKRDVGLGVELLAEILRDSVFDPDELAREQNVIVQEIGAVQDTPDDLVFDHFTEAAYPGQPIGRPILGTVESVTGFTRGDIRAFLDRNYRGPAMVLAGAGAVDHGELVRLGERLFADMPSDPGPLSSPAHYAGGEQRLERDHEQVNLVLGLEGVPWGDDRFEAAMVLASVLGGGMSSRLFQEVRETRGLCYAIQAFHWGFEDTGIFGISAATGEEDTQELVSVTAQVIAHLQEDADEEEVGRAKAQITASILMGLEGSMARAERLSRYLLGFGRLVPVPEVVARIEAVDARAVRTLARDVLTAARPTLAAVGPLDTLPALDRVTDMLGTRLEPEMSTAAPWRS